MQARDTWYTRGEAASPRGFLESCLWDRKKRRTDEAQVGLVFYGDALEVQTRARTSPPDMRRRICMQHIYGDVASCRHEHLDVKRRTTHRNGVRGIYHPKIIREIQTETRETNRQKGGH